MFFSGVTGFFAFFGFGIEANKTPWNLPELGGSATVGPKFACVLVAVVGEKFCACLLLVV